MLYICQTKKLGFEVLISNNLNFVTDDLFKKKNLKINGSYAEPLRLIFSG